MIENVPGTMPFVKSGKLRALAITSPSARRSAPDLPTMVEAGVPGYEMSGWNGMFAAKARRPDRGETARRAASSLRAPEMKEQFAALGAEPVGDTPDHFAAFLKADMRRAGERSSRKRASDPNS